MGDLRAALAALTLRPPPAYAALMPVAPDQAPPGAPNQAHRTPGLTPGQAAAAAHALVPSAPDQAPAGPTAAACALAAALLETPEALDMHFPNTAASAPARRLEEALQLLVTLEIHRVLAVGTGPAAPHHKICVYSKCRSFPWHPGAARCPSPAACKAKASKAPLLPLNAAAHQ